MLIAPIEVATAPAGPPRVPFATVLISIAAFWGVYFALTTLRSLIGLDFESELLVPRLIVGLVGIGVTLLMWVVLRQVDRRSLAVKALVALAIAAPAALLVAKANRAAFSDIEQRFASQLIERQGGAFRRDAAGNFVIEIPGARAGDGPMTNPAGRLVLPYQRQEQWRELSTVALGFYFQLVAWAALYFALLAGLQARAAERREGEFRRAAKAAELRSLRYQVNPHFLFNSFNSLSSLVMTGRQDEAEQMIQKISHFYRRSLADDTTADVTLDQEFALQRLYLEIEQIRFPERLMTRYDLPAALAEARIPGLLLQPLVENSVRYAVAPTRRTVTVRIAAEEEFGRLLLTVSDDGGPAAAADIGGHGIGLANVRERLAARFGGAAEVLSGPGEDGWRTVIRLPLMW